MAYVRIRFNLLQSREEIMAKRTAGKGRSVLDAQITPQVAAILAGVIYQARLQNRQAKLNIPEEEVIEDVVGLWRRILDALQKGE
jgi:hypothetical protein